jgi:S1-C subfamily serine protease
MTALEELSSGARSVAERLGSATVAIGRGGRGTGLVIGPNRVLTNAHNLRDETTTVSFGDGRSVAGRVVGADPDGDVVVLEADTADTPAVVWADDAPSTGDAVFGVARAGGRLRVTFGLITAVDAAFRGPRGRVVRGAVEHCAPLARGSSGGAIADAEGRVLALNTHRAGPGFYAARPADAAFRSLVERLAAGESVTRRSLGVALAPAHVARKLRRAVGLPDREGVLVREVVADSAAARSGLVRGDLVVAADGREVTDVDVLHEVLDTLGVAKPLVLGVVRGSEELQLTVSFGEPASSGETDPS